MDPILFIIGLTLFAYLAFTLGTFTRPKPTIRQAASIIGRHGRQTQLRTQAEKTRAIHDELRENIGSSHDHAQPAVAVRVGANPAR